MFTKQEYALYERVRDIFDVALEVGRVNTTCVRHGTHSVRVHDNADGTFGVIVNRCPPYEPYGWDFPSVGEALSKASEISKPGTAVPVSPEMAIRLFAISRIMRDMTSARFEHCDRFAVLECGKVVSIP